MWRTFLISLAFLTPALPQGAPSTDIYLVDLEPSLRVQNLTRRVEYDNQPHFLPGDKFFLYSSQRAGQSDIYRFDLATGSSTQLTLTAESEYSATPMPDNLNFSVIRVESNGKQRLWRFQLDGTNPRVLVEGLEPVGYQAWPSRDQVVTFVLGSPATLQLASPRSSEVKILARQIGRCLQLVPGERAVSYVTKAESPWMIRKWNADTGVIENVAPVLEGSEDYTWTADGTLFMGEGSVLYSRERNGKSWRRRANLGPHGISGMTRLAASQDGTKILVVARSNAGSAQ